MTDFISGKAAIARDERGHDRLKWELTKTLRIMKLGAFFLLAAAMTVSAKGLTQDKITLSLKNAPLEKVFDAIESQSGFVFIYKNETVKDKKVSIQVTNVSLADALNECLKGQALSYSIVGKSVAIKTIHKETGLAENATPNAPPLIDVKGKVLNEKGDPVEGVTVRVKGTEKFTLTDKNGEFSLITVERDAILLFTHITMEAFELQVSGQTELLIKLRTKVSSLGEVVVSVNTGYQQVSKERFVGSVSSLDSAAYSRRAGMDIISRLDGTVPGVLFDKKTASTSLDQVQIRGLSTLNSSRAPLVIVDNFPFRQDLSLLNPNDVESITVLKDAAATSIWGAQAGNGVIVITTKKGRYNQPMSVSVSSNVTIQQKPDLYYNPQISVPDFIDAETFLFSKGRYDIDLNNTSTWPVISPVVEVLAKRRAGVYTAEDSATQIDAMRSMDLRRELNKYMYRPAVLQQHYVQLNGGNNTFSYNFSAGYNRNQNNIQNSKVDDNFTLKSFTAIRPVKNLEITTSIMYIQGTNRSTTLPSLRLYPYAQLADQEGHALAIPQDRRAAYIDTVGGGRLLDWHYRPLDEVKLADKNDRSRLIQLNTSIAYRFTPWLNASLSYQYSGQSLDGSNYLGPGTYYTRNLINQYTNLAQTLPGLRNPIPVGGIMNVSHIESRSQNARAQLNFNKKLGYKHAVNALVAGEISETRGTGNTNRFYGYNKEMGTYVTTIDYVTQFPSYNNIAGSGQIPTGSTASPETYGRFVSFLGNLSYTYNDRYTIYLSARKDGSNIFGVNTNRKWKPLWSTGGSWDISKESFYDLKWMSSLRVRASYGYSGNPGNVSALPTIQYNTIPAVMTNLPAATTKDAPNPSLRWEKVQMINEAIDFSLFHNRISGSIDVFQKRSTDLIAPNPLAPATGVDVIYMNVADLEGKGFDIAVHSKNIQGAFQWQTDVSLSRSKTIIKRVFKQRYNTSEYLDYGVNASDGIMAYGMSSYKWAGLDPATGNPRGYLANKISTDYNAILNDSINNQVFNGSAVPLVFGFLKNSFSWKRFTLSANINYRLDFYFRKPAISYSDLSNSWQGNADYAARWQKSGDEQFTSVPSFIYPLNQSRDKFYQYSAINVLRGDNIRLQDLRLQYDWGSRQKKTVVKNWQVFVYVNNLNAILWRKNNSNLDPDYTGGMGFITPPAKSWTIGINANL
ncbi:hypothetical protein A4D02_20925 [Niastella koreensis]|uniref:TonB-dependent receptor n=2 Tax=Niastella koreensis TaxID=354356 RepID=G8TMX4_NIAKG|nr:SusC/RagA family TonB-linked outer membrane protein [Niastella koreensis]AEV96636.1 TonB-dependent receptor [Niastella koreensis GR20-10]OQP54145.1 hypothetical protein A4D02_20925 [Niastella koreensis]